LLRIIDVIQRELFSLGIKDLYVVKDVNASCFIGDRRQVIVALHNDIRLNNYYVKDENLLPLIQDSCKIAIQKLVEDYRNFKINRYSPKKKELEELRTKVLGMEHEMTQMKVRINETKRRLRRLKEF
jgi:hypothetical protein